MIIITNLLGVDMMVQLEKIVQLEEEDSPVTRLGKQIDELEEALNSLSDAIDEVGRSKRCATCGEKCLHCNPKRQ
jgi:hypothetical protein